MRFTAKIGLLLLAVGVLPVALLGSASYTVSRDELQRTVGRMQERSAEDLALFTERFVWGAIENLRLSTSAVLPLDVYSPSELRNILGLQYRQLPFLSVLAIVGDDKAPVAGPIFVPIPRTPSDQGRTEDAHLAGRVQVSEEALDAFVRRLPSPPAENGRLELSAPYRGADGIPRLAVALRLEPNRTLAAEILLADVASRVAELSREGGGVAYLVDGRGELLAHGEPDGRIAPEERRLPEAGFAANAASSQLVHRADGRRWLAAFAPVGTYRWGAVVAQPMHVAFAAADNLASYTVTFAGVAILLALGVGWLLARRVTRPVQRLSRAAAAIAAGDYGTPVEARGRDEIADLGRAFGGMTAEIRRRDEEIRGWNRELQARVEERTAELKAAQDQILRTRRLAALGSLGAGIAHELNNPMTAITGYLAILKKELGPASPQGELIAHAQEQATRVARVIEDLRSFADQERAAQGQRFSLVRPVRAALDLYEDRLRAAGIEVQARFEEPLPDTQGNPVQLQQVVAHLVENAMNAMPDGGRLEVSLGSIDGDALRLRIADTGKGIPSQLRERIFDPFFTTKDQAGRVGLGLSVSHSIVEAHRGKILVESEEGAGAAITVLLPAAAAAHLV
ncbi:MAG TPA: ATP-binding protein [Anaeromyxobacter sp.]|nr:ATP-binding protein [Anaeromyxobacter sp.]